MAAKLHAAAARFYAAVFAERPGLADDLRAAHRYNAACCATLAGCGQSKDTGKLDDRERARLRRQALDWLKADLALRRKQLGESPGDVALARQALAHWQKDPALAGVRDRKGLDKLPEAERAGWAKLWAEVYSLLTPAPRK